MTTPTSPDKRIPTALRLKPALRARIDAIVAESGDTRTDVIEFYLTKGLGPDFAETKEV